MSEPLSKRRSPAEGNYLATELEVGALVGGISKLPHYSYGHQFIVSTDHIAIGGPAYAHQCLSQHTHWLMLVETHQEEDAVQVCGEHQMRRLDRALP